MHRRSSTATDASFQPMFIPESSNSSNLATSAPANMGFEYHPFQPSNSIEANNNNHLAKSLEDEYTLQMK